MNESKTEHLVHQVENWGYYLLPRTNPHSPGHTGLLVAIRETPTRMHFDPESIKVQILDQDGTPEWATLHRKWRLWAPSRICAGRVILRDRLKKTVEFFTFGGMIESVSVPGETVYSLRSPAPVIDLTETSESPSDDFVFEVEALIGKLHAAWGKDDTGFGRHLGQTDPEQLYVASLYTVLVQLKQTQALREGHPELYTLLLEEKGWLKKANRWPAAPPMLEQLLAP